MLQLFGGILLLACMSPLQATPLTWTLNNISVQQHQHSNFWRVFPLHHLYDADGVLSLR